MDIHAAVDDSGAAQTRPSNRSFGLLFVVVFALVAAWMWWRASGAAPWWLAASVLVGVITLGAPGCLTPLNRGWMKLAELLHRVASPVVLGVLFYAVVTPFGLCRRMLGGDPLARRFDAGLDSYWIDRTPPGPPPDSFPHQF